MLHSLPLSASETALQVVGQVFRCHKQKLEKNIIFLSHRYGYGLAQISTQLLKKRWVQCQSIKMAEKANSSVFN